MADDAEVIRRVTAKLAGEFYIGQPVRIVRSGTSTFEGREGVISESDPGMPLHIGVEFGEHSDGETLYFFRRCVEPL